MIEVGDQNFDLTFNILVGIKMSISSLNEISALMELNENHFRMKHKMENEWVSNFKVDQNDENPENPNNH
jgi:hypothetical protein